MFGSYLRFVVLASGLASLGISRGAAAANFEVHGVSPKRAAEIAASAEDTLEAVATLLHGDDHDPAWTVPCHIHIHRTASSFARAVGGPPEGAKGATSIEFTGDVVAKRRIDVMDAGSGTVPGALAHEIVHVVLADRFTDGPPPRWADEGLAVMFDDMAKQHGHDADFRAARSRGMTWSISHLMAMDQYPREGHRQRVFYGQSASLVRWLIEKRDAATFLNFVDDASTMGASAAVRHHYGYKSLATLERAWLAAPIAVASTSPQVASALPSGRQ